MASQLVAASERAGDGGAVLSGCTGAALSATRVWRDHAVQANGLYASESPDQPRAGRARVAIAGRTARALENARFNGLEGKTTFFTRNLFELSLEDLRKLGKFDRMLIDPPRDGAMEVCQALAGLLAIDPEKRPKRIVYVSCNPATLARDAGILVNGGGYAIAQAGVINMFPHTAHVESIAVFERID